MSVISALRLSRSPAAAFMVVGLYWGTFAANVPVLKAQIGASDALFGTLLLGSAFGLVSSMWLAPRADKLLGPWGMITGSLLLVLAFLLPGLATTPLTFFLCMIAVGTASGLTDVLMNARVSDLESRHSRALMNANHGMFSLAYALAAIGSGLGREAGLSPVALFLVVGIVALLLCSQMYLVMPAQTDDNSATPRKLPVAPILLCGLVVLVAFMSEATVETWSALHVERTLGGGAAEGALGPAMLGFTMAFGRFSGQVLAERWPETRIILWAALLTSAGAGIAALAPTPAVAYLGFAAFGLGVSVIGPMGLALVGRIVAPRYRTEAISKAAVIGFSGFFLAPLLMGLVSEAFGLRVAFASVALLLLAIWPLSRAILRLAPHTAKTANAALTA